MSFTTIKEEAARLSPDERKELAGYLISLNRTMQENEGLRRELARKCDDNDSSHWVTLEQAEEMLLK